MEGFRSGLHGQRRGRVRHGRRDRAAQASAPLLSAGGPSTIEATRLVAAGTLWARLPGTLLVCTTPSANAAATLAATAAPISIMHLTCWIVTATGRSVAVW